MPRPGGRRRGGLDWAAGEIRHGGCTVASAQRGDVVPSAAGPLFQGIPSSENKPYKLARGVGSVKAAADAARSAHVAGTLRVPSENFAGFGVEVVFRIRAWIGPATQPRGARHTESAYRGRECSQESDHLGVKGFCHVACGQKGFPALLSRRPAARCLLEAIVMRRALSRTHKRYRQPGSNQQPLRQWLGNWGRN
jgi:hypothetical protein